jgi:hypothetical protein
MDWSTFHRRAEVMESVIAEAGRRKDGALPTDVPGVAERFRGEEDLLGALRLRWYNHLAGAIERELAVQPVDLEEAVVSAWRRTDADLPGVREILAAHRPIHEGPAATAEHKEWELLGVSAGQGSISGGQTLRAGRRIEGRARRHRVTPSRFDERNMLRRPVQPQIRGPVAGLRRRLSRNEVAPSAPGEPRPRTAMRRV